LPSEGKETGEGQLVLVRGKQSALDESESFRNEKRPRNRERAREIAGQIRTNGCEREDGGKNSQ